MEQADTGQERREPRGFALRYAAASFGAFVAMFAPALGGLSVKVQGLVGIDAAPRVLGLIMAIGFFAGPVTQPIVGQLSDNTTSRFGMRKPWLVGGSLGFMLALLGVGMASSLPLVAAFYCVAQICSNVVQGTMQASVADNVPDNRLGSVAGIGAAAIPIAKMAAALALYMLATNFLRIALPGLVGGLCCLYFALSLKDRRLVEPPEPFSFRVILKSYSFKPLLYRDYGLAWVTKALIMFGIASNSSYLTLFLGSAFQMNVDEQLLFNVYATGGVVVTTVFSSLVGGWASDKIGRRKPFVTGGGLLISAGVTILAVAPFLGRDGGGLALVLVGEACIGLGFGLFLAVDTALCIDVLPNEASRAKDLGVLSLANTLPGTIAPLVAGTFVIPAGNMMHAGYGYSIWFATSAIIATSGALLVLKIRSVR